MSDQDKTKDQLIEELVETRRLKDEHAREVRELKTESNRAIERGDSDEYWQLFSQATSNMLWNWNFEDDSVERNIAFETAFGYGHEEVTPVISWWVDRLHKGDRDRVLGIFQKACDSGKKTCNYEYRFLRKDGSYASISDKVFILHDQTGKPIRALGAMTDITKETELRLHAKIFANMSEGVCLVRVSDKVIVHANLRFEEMFGYDLGEMSGMDVSNINAPTEIKPEETAEKIVGILKEKGVWRSELRNIKKDGTPFWCHACVTVMPHPEHGEVFVSVHTDISDRKQKEQDLEISCNKLEDALTDLRAAQKELLQRERLSAVGQLAAGVAHDFNNLLTVIQGNVELLTRDSNIPPGPQRRLKVILDRSKGAARLVRKILDFSRQSITKLENLNLEEWIEENIAILKSGISENITIKLECEPGEFMIQADTIQLLQVQCGL